MLQFKLQIYDDSKAQFVLDVLRLMSFVDIQPLDETQVFDTEAFVKEIYAERERNKQVLDAKIDTLFDF